MIQNMHKRILTDPFSVVSVHDCCEYYSPEDDVFTGVKLPTINLPTFTDENSDLQQFKCTLDNLIMKNTEIGNM